MVTPFLLLLFSEWVVSALAILAESANAGFGLPVSLSTVQEPSNALPVRRVAVRRYCHVNGLGCKVDAGLVWLIGCGSVQHGFE